MASRIIGTIDLSGYQLKDDLNYINSIIKVTEEYDEFAQGYWHNLSLMNASGEAGDTQYRNSIDCLSTQHMHHCKGISSLIQDNFNYNGLRMVRTRNLIDGMVIPHKDFVELNRNFHYFRIFVPLEENLQSFHSDENGVFQMRPGEVWVLDATINHAAINFSNKSRVFLCLDYVFTQEFNDYDSFKESAKIVSTDRDIYIKRKLMHDDHEKSIIDGLAKVISRLTFKDLLFAASKYHFIYQVPVTIGFYWLKKAADIAKDQEVFNKVQVLERYLTERRELGERLVLNSWEAA